MKWCLPFVLCSAMAIGQSFSSFLDRLQGSPEEERSAIVRQYVSTIQSFPIIDSDSAVHIVLYGTAGTVLVNGDLQGWLAPDTLHEIPCGDESFFFRSYVLPSDARLDYLFIVDGGVRLDSANPYTAPSGYGPHSEMRMPKFISSPYLVFRDSIAHGTIDSIGINPYLQSPLKQHALSNRPLKIYRPPGYDSLSNLPSVYVQDGAEAIDFAFLPTIIDNLIAEKKIEPLIAVFIQPLNRLDEQLGSQRDRYKKYLCNDLVAMIDKRYKTNRSPEKRALIGISSSGNSALHVALNRPDVFRNAGAQSATITQDLQELVRTKAARNTIPSAFKMYLDCGRFDLRFNDGGDFLTLNRKFSDLLSSLRIPHYYKEINDGHQWGSWRERMPEMLIFFFGK